MAGNVILIDRKNRKIGIEEKLKAHREGKLHRAFSIFVFIGKFDGKIKPNKKEVMNYKWISMEELKKDAKKNPSKYAIWLRIALRKMKISQIKKRL